MNWEGVFMLLLLCGSIMFPSFMGVINWGGLSIDPVCGILVVNIM